MVNQILKDNLISLKEMLRNKLRFYKIKLQKEQLLRKLKMEIVGKMIRKKRRRRSIMGMVSQRLMVNEK